MSGRRITPQSPKLVGRDPQDYALELQRFLDSIAASNDDGLPVPHGSTHDMDGDDPLTEPGDPTTITVGDAADPGSGPAKANEDHAHAVETQAPAGLANAAVTGSTGKVSDAGHQHKRDVRVAKAGVDVGTRNRINFIEGANVTLTVSDDAGNDEVDVTVVAVGGGSGVWTVSAKTANHSVDGATEGDYFFTNEGAAGSVTFTLPAAAGALHFAFYVQAAQVVIIQAAAGDTIRVAGKASAAAGTARTAVQGCLLELMGINGTEWVAMSVVGAWEVA